VDDPVLSGSLSAEASLGGLPTGATPQASRQASAPVAQPVERPSTPELPDTARPAPYAFEAGRTATPPVHSGANGRNGHSPAAAPNQPPAMPEFSAPFDVEDWLSNVTEILPEDEEAS
jgi:hypothetical protein